MLQIIKDNDDDDTPKKKKAQPKSAARAALEAAMEILQGRIISNPNDMFGILLFGTEEAKNPPGTSDGLANIYILMDLDVPDADGIKELKSLLEGLALAVSNLMKTKSIIQMRLGTMRSSGLLPRNHALQTSFSPLIRSLPPKPRTS